MSGKERLNVEGEEDLIPTKEALKSLKSDVTLESAIAELVDNSLDQWLRNYGGESSLSVEVVAERYEAENRTELVVRDNAGGVSRSDAKVVFTLGDSGDRGGQAYIGSYGLGAKKALMNLGIPFTIASRHENEDVGWAYTINKEWFDSATDWSVNVRAEEDIEPGVTELRVHDLNYDWFNGSENESDDAPQRSIPERLRDAFGQIYNLYLADNMGQKKHDVTIEVQGKVVQPLGTPDYSFTPVDDMYPRRFENLTVDLDGWAKTHVSITVGLLRESDVDTAGVDVYMQGRQVLYAAQDNRVGFDSDFDRFDPQHDGRFKAIVEIETRGEGRDLPWDTQKSNVDPHNPIMREIRNMISRATSDYLFLDDTKVPKAIVYPYHRSYPEAANGGEIAVHDFSSQQKVTSPYRPGTEREELNELINTARAHARMRFRCEDAVDDDFIPAYRRLIDRKLREFDELEYNMLEELAVNPVDFNHSDAEALAQRIERLAQTHVEAGVRHVDDLPVWQRPKYRDALEEAIQHTELSIKELDDPEELPDGIPATIEEIEQDSNGSEEADTGQDQADQEAIVEIALRVISTAEGEGKEAPIKEMYRSEALDALDLDKNADDEEIFNELNQRVQMIT